MNKKIRIKYVVEVGIFAALSVVLYFLRFPLPIFPSFLEIQFSALPIVIIGFSLGPVAGAITLLIKSLICLPFTTTMGVGDLADLLIGLSFILTTSLIYKKNKTKKGAIIALCFGSLAWIISAVVMNYFVLVPFFIEMMFKGNVEGFVSICQVIPNITISNYKIYYVLFATIPFNLIISTVVSLVTFFVYKKISGYLKS